MKRRALREHQKAMFRWPVPRHQAEVAGNDMDDIYCCRDSALEVTPQRNTRLKYWICHLVHCPHHMASQCKQPVRGISR